ncbi:hypothetical protein V502_10837 [Pseudogymnoascus sp. VKM F-4520 (FW-2644)]|nr:hypothetical protein V502_10837 [Pseudogymnoascus sp. VKM F-4520 (FW-2644)]
MDGPRRKKFAPRSRKGCMSCRQRKKRCDEGRPACANCLRVNVTCEWTALTHVGLRRRRPRGAEILETTSPKSPNRSLTHGSTPDLDLCDHSTGPAFALSASPALTNDQRYLLTYYIRTLVPTFSVLASPSVYHVSLYVPMAFQSPGVLNAILASAASHLAKTTLGLDRADHFGSMAKAHLLVCHKHLQEVVNDEANSARNSIETVAILMLLVALETQNGSKGAKWQHQLACAGNIVAALGGPQHFIKAGWESQSVFGHFLYHDFCAMAVDVVRADVDSRRSNISGRLPDWTSLCPENSFDEELNLGLDPLMGCASSLFVKIRQIGLLRQLPDSSLKRLQLYTTLEEHIRGWNIPDRNPAEDTVREVGLAAQLDLRALAESYRLGALILLYRTSDVSSTVLSTIAKQIMSYVARIPDGNQVESGLAFPLFMAGGELVGWEDMESCALKLRGIRDRTSLMNIQGIEEILESIWRSKLNGAKKDWVDIFREESHAICIA